METTKSANVILQIVDSTLSWEERDRTVQLIWDDLTQLEIVPPAHITPLIDKSQDPSRYGLMVKLSEPDRLQTWIRDLSDRLEVTPVEIRLTCTIDRMRVQIQTALPDVLLSVLAAVNAIMPAEQVFRARAELYAHREGEIAPVERANLDLLREQLQLSPETAEHLIEKALGPYKTKEAKLKRYREVFNAELERHQQQPFSDTTWTELKQLAEALQLPKAAVDEVNQEYIARIHAEQQRHLAEAEATLRQAATQRQDEEAQRQVATQQNYAELYRQEFTGAIAHNLFPNEFDRGRLEQARRNWSLDSELVRAIEREVTDEHYGPIDSAHQLDYTRLRQLLWANQWEAADQETERLMLTALSQDMRPLEENAILRLSCVDLQTIDALWSRYSEGRFGFAAQQQVYVQKERLSLEFLSAVGWMLPVGVGGVNLTYRPAAYHELQFNLGAPQGHLPTWRWGADNLQSGYTDREETVHTVFREWVEKCLPGLKTTSSSAPSEEDQELS